MTAAPGDRIESPGNAVRRPSAQQSLFVDQPAWSAFTDGILDWLFTNREWFRPPREDRLGLSEPSAIQRGGARKAFGELGAALRIAQRVPEIRARPTFQALRQHWLAALDEQRAFHDITVRPGLFFHGVALYAIARDLDPEAAADVGHQLQHVLDQGYAGRSELSAWTRLDLRYYLDAPGLSHRLPSTATLVAASSLTAPPALAFASDMDLYAITHILFDVTDFGAVDGRALLHNEVEVIDYTYSALDRSLSVGNWDLAIEFLMCRRYLAVTEALDRQAIAVIGAAQALDGAIPRSSDAARLASLGGASPFEICHHATVVGLFLAAAGRSTNIRT